MAYYNFQLDLKNAKAVEREFVQLLSKTKDIKSVSFNDDFRYDVLVDLENESIKYEVKHDIMSCKTGNLALEYECRGKDSGINHTEADIWVYKLGDSFYCIPVEKLKELIAKELYFRTVVGGDRGSNTKMYLFRLSLIKTEMKILMSRKIVVDKSRAKV